MIRKIIWLLVSCLMVLSLVMASCGPAEEEEEAEVEEEVVEEEVEEEEEEEEGLIPPEVPKYGGILTTIGSDPMGWDEAYTNHIMVPTEPINEELLQGDWTKGPAGTGETDWLSGFLGLIGMETGCLAESWELPDDETVIYHIRKGVYWQDKPPVNGREFTAYDAAWNLERNYTTPTAYLAQTYPAGTTRPISWKALDKYTVEMKVRPEQQGLALMVGGDFCRHYAPEVIDVYGDAKDWRNACGTGPFMLTDYTVGSSMTWEKNPNYWQNDPLHPENQLPYIDGCKSLIIPDLSTQLAALRTGKIDFMSNVSWENAELLIKQCPELEYVRNLATAKAIFWRMDKPELPFKDIRVRQALNMVINQQELVDDYYKGNADLFAVPFPNDAAHSDIFTPLEEMPEVVQEMFTYNPEKAKQLLKDAGYPNGFHTSVVCGSAADADFLSIIKGYFQVINVEMDIQMLESGVYSSVLRGRKHEEMIYEDTKNRSYPFRMLDTQDTTDNAAFFKAPETDAAYAAVCAAIGKDDAEVNRVLKEITPFRLEQAYASWLPAEYVAQMWWPWLQNFHAEIYSGYNNSYLYKKYSWIDQALKKSMGY